VAAADEASEVAVVAAAVADDDNDDEPAAATSWPRLRCTCSLRMAYLASMRRNLQTTMTTTATTRTRNERLMRVLTHTENIFPDHRFIGVQPTAIGTGAYTKRLTGFGR